MTPRERWIAILQGHNLDRIPTDLWATREFLVKFEAAVGCRGEDLLRQIGIDQPKGFGPIRKSQSKPVPPGEDMWGLRHRKISYGSGEYSEVDYHPLANMTSVAEIETYAWPSPDDFEFCGIADQLSRYDGYRIVKCGAYEPFLLYCALRGMEQAYQDMIEEPAILEAGLTKIFEFCYEFNRRIWEAGGGKIDLMYLAEDLGGQHGPLFSLGLYRRFLRDGQQKMADLARSFKIRIFYHTDGSARLFLPDLIDVVGIDILNPLQWQCPGMELQGLVSDFGKHIAFHGGIDNQHTLPFGSTDDVRAEVRNVAKAMQNARWICAPCHNIQAVGPVENVLAMYDEAAKLAVSG